MREVGGWVTGLERVEFTNLKTGEEVKRVRVYWFGQPLESKDSVGSEARMDICASSGVPRELVPAVDKPVRCVLVFEDKLVNGEVYGRRRQVLLPTLREVRFPK